MKLVTGEDGKKLDAVTPERAELLVRMFELMIHPHHSVHEAGIERIGQLGILEPERHELSRGSLLPMRQHFPVGIDRIQG